jgi:uncharacterized membrane protein
MLKALLMLASLANCGGGLVLVATWAMMWQRVPIIVLFIGGALMIQGAYTTLYVHGDLDRWADLATGALFAGQCLLACAGAFLLIQGIIHNATTQDGEAAPVLAGFLILSQALLALIYLFTADRLRPRLNGHNAIQ